MELQPFSSAALPELCRRTAAPRRSGRSARRSSSGSASGRSGPGWRGAASRRSRRQQRERQQQQCRLAAPAAAREAAAREVDSSFASTPRTTTPHPQPLCAASTPQPRPRRRSSGPSWPGAQGGACRHACRQPADQQAFMLPARTTACSAACVNSDKCSAPRIHRIAQVTRPAHPHQCVHGCMHIAACCELTHAAQHPQHSRCCTPPAARFAQRTNSTARLHDSLITYDNTAHPRTRRDMALYVRVSMEAAMAMAGNAHTPAAACSRSASLTTHRELPTRNRVPATAAPPAHRMSHSPTPQ